MEPAISIHAFHWPEFIALAERLNIDLRKSIRKCRISLDIEDAVIVDCQYVGDDMSRASEQEDG